MRKNSVIFRSLILAAAVGIFIPLSACHRTDLHQTLRNNAISTLQGSPVLLAVYQPWFGTKEHIDVGYSTQDRAVIEQQVQQAKNLGISGFVVNWYGPRKEFMDKSYGLIQDVASRNDFKVAMQYDQSVDNPSDQTDAVIVDLQYAYDRYIAPHAATSRQAYIRYNGRPVIFVFPKGDKTDWNRVRQVLNSWEDPPLLIYKDQNVQYSNNFDGFYAWVQPDRSGWTKDGSNWGQQYLEDFYTRMKTQYPNKIAVGAAWPGFDDKSASWGQNRYMDARCGKTLEESLRLFRRYYSNDNPLPFLLIVTWNDYEEGTAIERGFPNCRTSKRTASFSPTRQ